MKKPEALQLAEYLELGGNFPLTLGDIAVELRRLHAENERLIAQRDALLEALRRIAMASEATVCNQEWIAKTARAAIKAVEETE